MIIDKTIKIRINGKNIKKYDNLGYIFKSNDMVDVKVEDMPLNSMVLISALCDYCGVVKKLSYRHYIRNIEKYNKFSCSVKCGKNKYKETMLETYGVDNYAKTDECKSKYKATMLETYGVDNYSKTNEFKKNINENNYRKNEDYRKSNFDITSHPDYIEYISDCNSLFKCDKGHKYTISSDNFSSRYKRYVLLCTICNPIGDSKSIKEKVLSEFIQSNYSGEIITSYRDRLEIDIYLPELKIGFEFNGLYWHSEKFKEKNYHLDKTNYFKDKGIRIIHIWEDDWTFKENIVKSQINNLLINSKKIFARKCIIKEVSIKSTREFLDDNHIQGFTSSSFKIGLYYNNELVSIMTFDSFEGRKKMEDGGYNLSRFCNKTGYNIVGGASKLLKYFERLYNPKRIISYADKDWSIGSLYYTLGFENIDGNGPDYKYIVDCKRVHKSNYKKSRLSTTFTESATMKQLDILRIYDCGKIKFEKRTVN